MQSLSAYIDHVEQILVWGDLTWSDLTVGRCDRKPVFGMGFTLFFLILPLFYLVTPVHLPTFGVIGEILVKWGELRLQERKKRVYIKIS